MNNNFFICYEPTPGVGSFFGINLNLLESFRFLPKTEDEEASMSINLCGHEDIEINGVDAERLLAAMNLYPPKAQG